MLNTSALADGMLATCSLAPGKACPCGPGLGLSRFRSRFKHIHSNVALWHVACGTVALWHVALLMLT